MRIQEPLRIALLIVCFAFSTGLNLLLIPANASGIVSGQTVPSSTWAGFGVDYSSLPGNQVGEVTGSWIVPKIQPSPNATVVTEYVQIGSDSSSAGVLILGTSQYSNHNILYYRAFYVRLPEDSAPQIWKNFTGGVGAGATIFADIHKSAPGVWTLGLFAQNSTSSLEYSQPVSFSGSEAAAEWGVYLPAPLTLASFGTVVYSFENASINGVQHSLNELPANKTMLSDTLESCNLASTSDLAADNKTFTVSYLTSACPLGSATLGSTPLFLEILIGGVAVVIALLAVMTVMVITSVRKKTPAQLTSTTVPPAANASNSSCQKCGQQFKPRDRFCQNCGSQRPT